MDKFLIKSRRHSSSSSTNAIDDNNESVKKSLIEVELSEKGTVDIVDDPGWRKPINSYPVGIRDELRRLYLTKGPCQPREYDFPKTCFGKSTRKFQKAWFDQYEWLEYSVHRDAAFCLVCYLFRGHKHGGDIFTEVGFRNWKKALEKFKEHEGTITSAHHYAKIQCLSFKDNIDRALRNKEMENDYHIRLMTVVDVVRFFLQEGWSFGGHDVLEKTMHLEKFLAFFKWYCECNEKVNKVMNLSDLGNNQLLSPEIQKDVINACATEVRKAIIDEIEEKFFVLLIDKTCERSVKEQMTVILRFVNNEGEVIERFLGGVSIGDTYPHSLKIAVDDFFARNGLSLSNARGLSYNVACNMRDEFNVLKTLIMNENKHSYYFHCFAYQPELVVATSKQHALVSKFFYHMIKIVNVIAAPCKRRDAIEQKHHNDIVQRIESGEIVTENCKNQETLLAGPSDTRWGSYYKTIKRVLEMWDAIADVLLNICEDGLDQRSRGAATGLVDEMLTFEFVFIAHLMLRLLAKTSVLSAALQQVSQNSSKVVALIPMVKDELKKYNEDGWENLLEIVATFCLQKDIFVPNMEDLMSKPFRYQRKADGQPKTYLQYFRHDIFFQVIDLIIQEMDFRFAESTLELLLGIACLDPKDSFASFDLDRLLRFAKLFPDDFNDEVMLTEELKQYISIVKTSEYAFFSGLETIGDLAKRMVERKWHTTLKLVYQLVEMALVLPITIATVERSFSTVKMMKNDLHDDIGDELLTDRLQCYIEKEVFAKIENEAILQHLRM